MGRKHKKSRTKRRHPFKCIDCKSKYRKPKKFWIHLFDHESLNCQDQVPEDAGSTEEPQCSKSFENVELLQASRRQFLECPHCISFFDTTKELTEHLVVHGLIVHPCPVENCTKWYQHLGFLRRHMRTTHQMTPGSSGGPGTSAEDTDQ